MYKTKYIIEIDESDVTTAKGTLKVYIDDTVKEYKLLNFNESFDRNIDDSVTTLSVKFDASNDPAMFH
jgi:hypothetical protein